MGAASSRGQMRALLAEFAGRHEELLAVLERVQDEIRRRLSARE